MKHSGRPAVKTPRLADRIREVLQDLPITAISIQKFKTSFGFTNSHPNLFSDAMVLALRESGWERRERSLFKIVDLIRKRVDLKPSKPLPIVALSEARIEEILAETEPWTPVAVAAAPAPPAMSPHEASILWRKGRTIRKEAPGPDVDFGRVSEVGVNEADF
jgi:hypothetical protein